MNEAPSTRPTGLRRFGSVIAWTATIALPILIFARYQGWIG